MFCHEKSTKNLLGCTAPWNWALTYPGIDLFLLWVGWGAWHRFPWMIFWKMWTPCCLLKQKIFYDFFRKFDIWEFLKNYFEENFLAKSLQKSFQKIQKFFYHKCPDQQKWFLVDSWPSELIPWKCEWMGLGKIWQHLPLWQWRPMLGFELWTGSLTEFRNPDFWIEFKFDFNLGYEKWARSARCQKHWFLNWNLGEEIRRRKLTFCFIHWWRREICWLLFLKWIPGDSSWNSVWGHFWNAGLLNLIEGFNDGIFVNSCSGFFFYGKKIYCKQKNVVVGLRGGPQTKFRLAFIVFRVSRKENCPLFKR